MNWRNPLGICDGFRVKLKVVGKRKPVDGFAEHAGDCFYDVMDSSGDSIWHGYARDIKSAEIVEPLTWKDRALSGLKAEDE